MLNEILTVRIKESTLKITGNRPSGIREKDITKKGARVFNQGKIYSASYVGEIDDEELLQNAQENRAGALDYDYTLPTLNSKQEKCINSDESISKKYTQDYLNALEVLRSEHPGFIFSGSCNYIRSFRNLKNSNNINHSMDADIFSWNIVFKDKKSANIIDGYIGKGSVGTYGIKDDFDHFRHMLNVHGELIELPNGKYPVVFLSQGQVLGKLIESFKIDNYHQGIGIYAGKLGEKIISDKITLSDSIYCPSKEAISLFDGDGMTRENPDLALIKNGVFTQVVSDLRNAQKYKATSTGNGVRSYRSAVNLDFHKLLLQDGKNTARELLKSLDRCVIVCMAAGGEFTDEGSYATPVQLGYLMKKGEYVGRLPQVTLKSTLQKMLGQDLMDVSKGSFSGLDSNPSLLMNMELINN